MTSSLAAELAIEDGSVDASPCIVFLITYIWNGMA